MKEEKEIWTSLSSLMEIKKMLTTLSLILIEAHLNLFSMSRISLRKYRRILK